MARTRPLPTSCNVLLVGGGGREHALAWKLRQSSRLGALWTTDADNAGLRALAQPCPISLQLKDRFHLTRWCDHQEIHLVVVGPEQPLAEGIADALASPSRLVFGPSAAAARLEADKAFAKELMRHASIPTAEMRIFTKLELARGHVTARMDQPCVVKASGLASGKGVVVCDNGEQALEALDRMLTQQEFGAAGAKVLIEERLQGQEVSVLALVDGRTITVLDPCQDHKQLHEGDKGPNTGGMGAYCPAPVVDAAAMAVIERQILVPTIDALRRDGIEYRGVLYAGLMLTPGGPKVLEFNCRFGDPECQVLVSRLESDLLELLWATAAGSLSEVEPVFDERVACCVVMASEGYPGMYAKGRPIEGIDDAQQCAGPGERVVVFHAGTKVDSTNRLVTNGGRVLGVTALARDLRSARDLANTACSHIRFEGAQYRRDIGHRVLSRQSAPARV